MEYVRTRKNYLELFNFIYSDYSLGIKLHKHFFFYFVSSNSHFAAIQVFPWARGKCWGLMPEL